jgi:O-antigen ligase
VIPYLVNAPRWLFLAALIDAPWVYGSTRPWAIQLLDAILGVVIVLWLAECVVRRRRPFVPWLLWGGALFLLLQGWGMMANAQASYDRDLFQFNVLKQLLPFAPGVVDRVDSIPAMLNDSAMLGAICFACDLAQRSVWRTRIWWTVALNGIVLMVWGLGMKIFGVHITSYYDPTDVGLDSFAFYFYHGNAGAYINLILPLVGGLAILAFIRRDAEAQRALWLPGLLICVASSVASLSKGGMAIALGLVIALAVWFVRLNADRERLALSRAQRAILIIGALAVLGAMLSLGGTGAAERWSALGTATGKDASVTERLLMCQVCFHMMGDSGFWGFGPGNFMICFPHYCAFTGDALAGIWVYAHEDYLQTIVEWGYVGALFFGVIFFGGIWTAWRRLYGAALSEEDTVLLTAVLLALGGVAIHALFDFPLQIASIQLYAATYVGICWGSPGIAGPSAPARRRRSSAGRSDLQAPAGGLP